MIRTFTLIILGSYIVLLPKLYAQDFFDGFETGGLANWEEVMGFAQTNVISFVNGTSSVRLFDFTEVGESESRLLHRTFFDDFGTYQYWCRGDGSFSDVNFLFQYLDANNYYELSHKPAGTDNPELALYKVIGGVRTALFTLDPVAADKEWTLFRIERSCFGDIQVFNNDSLLVEVIDMDIMVPGKLGLGAWDQFSYFDDIQFWKAGPVAEVTLNETICQGEFYEVGSNQYDSAGTYRDTVPTATGCDSIVILELSVLQQITTEMNFQLCSGESIMVNGQEYSSAGTFQEVIQAANGCDSILNLTIEIGDRHTTFIDTTFCAGDILYIGNLEISEPNNYLDTLQSKSGCDSILQIEANLAVDIFSLGPDLPICPGENLLLSAPGYQEVTWSTGEQTPSVTFNVPGSYFAEVVDQFGCMHRDTILLYEKCASAYFAPNVFSPNGDTVNDTWHLIFSEFPEQFSLSLYDRWGNVLFNTSDINFEWDGKANTQNVVEGVYVWQANIDGVIESGHLTLIR